MLIQVCKNEGLSIDSNRLSDVLYGGEYYVDINYGYRQNRVKVLFCKDHNSPRDYLCNKIKILGMKNRP